MVSFNPQVSIDTIIALMGILIAVFSVYNKIKITLAVMQSNFDVFMSRITKLEEEIDRLAKVTETMAVQNERQNAMELRIDEVSTRVQSVIEHHIKDVAVQAAKAKRRGGQSSLTLDLDRSRV